MIAGAFSRLLQATRQRPVMGWRQKDVFPHREVFAAVFRDRVAHHLLVSHQATPLRAPLHPRLLACRTGKGTLAAGDRLLTFLRQMTANVQRPAWALKLDVARASPSIHKATLATILERQSRHPALRWLTHTLLFHDPTTKYH